MSQKNSASAAGSSSNPNTFAESPSQKAQDAASSAKTAAEDVLSQGCQVANDVAAEAKSAVKSLAAQVGQQASELSEEAQRKLESTAAAQKSKASSQIDGVASALRQTGDGLRLQEQDSIAHYVDAAADQAEKISGYLQNRDIAEIASEVRRFGKEQPEMFVAGALTVGFFLGRFFKSSETKPASTRQMSNVQNLNYGQPVHRSPVEEQLPSVHRKPVDDAAHSSSHPVERGTGMTSSMPKAMPKVTDSTSSTGAASGVYDAQTGRN